MQGWPGAAARKRYARIWKGRLCLVEVHYLWGPMSDPVMS